jgi:pre-rRNA-processing protein IPI1
LDNLIQHLKHYNAGTRKGAPFSGGRESDSDLLPDAIAGLREILEAHRILLDSGLSTLINACVRIIADEVCGSSFRTIPLTPMLQDAGVRKALLGLFAWVLPQVPQVRTIIC